jgi:hypothetical protein
VEYDLKVVGHMGQDMTIELVRKSSFGLKWRNSLKILFPHALSAKEMQQLAIYAVDFYNPSSLCHTHGIQSSCTSSSNYQSLTCAHQYR